MKQVLILFTFLFGLNLIHAQIFGVEKIKDAGDNDKRLNLVILSEGYQAIEFAKFKDDAESLVTNMFSQSPFLEYAHYFNVHIINVPSNESGADHPGTAIGESGITPVFKDTYFNATFDAFKIHRFLYYGIDYADAAAANLKINAVLSANFPTYDQALILVNSTEYGGTGGEFPISSTGFSANELAIHELGHSMFNLADEYLVPDEFYKEAVNMTQEMNPSSIKWKNWVDTNGVDIFPYGTSGVAASWYKPRHKECKMELLDKPFCSVCKEGMVERIHDLISPIESYIPNNNTIDDPNFPVNFELDLIKPQPNTLDSSWILNGNNLDTNVYMVSIPESALVIGTNYLTALIEDDSNFIDVDNHDIGSHIYTVEWTINYTTLGIKNLDSTINKYDILLYPNPTSNILNLKFESEIHRNLSVQIIGLGGKEVKSISVNGFGDTQIDISHLSNGVYLANFYSGNTLISSKRLVKN